jgi:hypothetical protein
MSLPDELVAEYDSVANDAQTLTFLARASELQREAIQRIDQFLPKLVERKRAAVQACDEAAANNILWMELALTGVRSELSMWLQLKNEEPEQAWDELIGAQSRIEAASCVRRQLGQDATRFDNLLNKLVVVERALFPPQMFNSVGGTGQRECAICGSDYAECGHIVGRAYMGEMCHTVLRNLQVQEVSIVDNPANKRCRITHFSDNGGMRNRMTWRLEDRCPEPPPGTKPGAVLVRMSQDLSVDGTSEPELLATSTDLPS